jgi:hypothetical protein
VTLVDALAAAEYPKPWDPTPPFEAKQTRAVALDPIGGSDSGRLLGCGPCSHFFFAPANRIFRVREIHE